MGNPQGEEPGFAARVRGNQPVTGVVRAPVTAELETAGLIVRQRDLEYAGGASHGPSQGDQARRVGAVTQGFATTHAAAVLEVQGLLAVVAAEEFHAANMRAEALQVEKLSAPARPGTVLQRTFLGNGVRPRLLGNGV